MKFKITAVNTKNPSEKFEYELEGESVGEKANIKAMTFDIEIESIE